MTTGVWEPGGAPAPKPVSGELLARFLTLAGSLDDAVSVDAVAAAGLADAGWVMKQDLSAWSGAEAFASDDLVRLAKLFTLLEANLSGWDAGSTSPVIAMVRMLKARGDFHTELRLWIKAHTKNRYLPHGSAL